VTGNAIAPAVAPQSVTPTQTVALIPEVYSFSKRVLVAGVSERVTLFGRRLNQIARASVNGEKATISSQVASELVLDIPALPRGEYDLSMKLESGASYTFLSAFTAQQPVQIQDEIPEVVSEQPKVFKLVRHRISNFGGDSAKLNQQVARQITRVRNLPGEVSQITCTGTTSARRSTNQDQLLAKARASAVCRELAREFPAAKVTIKAWPASGIGARHRAVITDLLRAAD
jgi:outer membrane protein OmpA-like peptidoglycan-associated protein